MNLLAELLLSSATRHPSQVFLTDTRIGRDFTYEELASATSYFHRFLGDRNVSKGDTVAFITKNSNLFFPLFFACASQGIALVPLNPDLHESETMAILKDSEPAALFHDPAEKLVLEHVKTSTPFMALQWNDALFRDKTGDRDCDLKAVKCIGDEPALIIYTSGTTGGCKGVVLTHTNLRSMAETFVSVYGYGPGQRFLCVLPFFHMNAPMITGLACIAGGSQVFLADTFGVTIAKFYWKTVEEYRIDTLSITPSIMKMLLALFPGGADACIDQVKFALVGSAFLPEPLWRSFEEKFKIPCYQGYGLTETTTWATMTPPDSRKKYHTAGIPVNCQVRIDPLEAENPGSPETGEVLIKGDIVMKGYRRNDTLTAQQMVNGWLRTGDLGYFDSDGQLVIAGRIKNIIKRKGILIFPEEIDHLLMKHGSVLESCTIGVGDDFREEQMISACVVKEKRENLEQELREYMLSNASPYKCPDGFVFLSELPRNSMGKVKLRELSAVITGEKPSAPGITHPPAE